MTFGAEPSLLALYIFLWSCAKKGGKNARQRSRTRGGKAKEEGKRGSSTYLARRMGEGI
jgi:hypothetical protein